jgi:hypothetical protein
MSDPRKKERKQKGTKWIGKKEEEEIRKEDIKIRRNEKYVEVYVD